MLGSLQLRRRGLFQDAKQMDIDWASYNDNNVLGVKLPPIDYNLNIDLEESRLQMKYPDEPETPTENSEPQRAFAAFLAMARFFSEDSFFARAFSPFSPPLWRAWIAGESGALGESFTTSPVVMSRMSLASRLGSRGRWVFSRSFTNEIGARRHFVLQPLARARWRLVPWRPAKEPDAARTWRRVVAPRNVRRWTRYLGTGGIDRAGMAPRRLTRASLREYAAVQHARYLQATRTEKRQLSDAVVAGTGTHRKSGLEGVESAGPPTSLSSASGRN